MADLQPPRGDAFRTVEREGLVLFLDREVEVARMDIGAVMASPWLERESQETREVLAGFARRWNARRKGDRMEASHA